MGGNKRPLDTSFPQPFERSVLANTASAEKRNRQAQKRRARNVGVRTGVKGAVKKVRDALDKGDSAGAKAALKLAERALDPLGRAAWRADAKSEREGGVVHQRSKPEWPRGALVSTTRPDPGDFA